MGIYGGASFEKKWKVYRSIYAFKNIHVLLLLFYCASNTLMTQYYLQCVFKVIK